MNTEDVIQEIEEQSADDSTPLAEDIEATLQYVANHTDLSSKSLNGLSPDMAMQLLIPMVREKANRDPDSTLRYIARIHLETGALLEKHTNTDPVSLINAE